MRTPTLERLAKEGRMKPSGRPPCSMGALMALRSLLSVGVGVAVALAWATGVLSWAGQSAGMPELAEGAVAQRRLESLTCLAYSPDGKWVAVGTTLGLIELLETNSLATVARFTGHTGKITALAFRPDGKILASASEDTTLRLWEVPTGGERAVLRRHIPKVDLAVVFSPDGRLLVTGLNLGLLLVWDVLTGHLLRDLKKEHEGR